MRLLLLFLFVIPASVVSAQITPISRDSEISRSDGELGNPASFTRTEVDSTSFSTFNESLFAPSTFGPVATQLSSFNNTTVSVSTQLDRIGTSSFGSDYYQTFGSIQASSTFSLFFSLAQPSEFSITGTLFEDDPVELGVGVNNGSSFFELDGPVSLFLESDPAIGQTIVNQNIILTPGVYSVEIGSAGWGNQIEPVADSSAQITFEFNSVVVPEPSSLILMSAFMSPLVVCRRRRRI